MPVERHTSAPGAASGDARSLSVAERIREDLVAELRALADSLERLPSEELADVLWRLPIGKLQMAGQIVDGSASP